MLEKQLEFNFMKEVRKDAKRIERKEKWENVKEAYFNREVLIGSAIGVVTVYALFKYKIIEIVPHTP